MKKDQTQSVRNPSSLKPQWAPVHAPGKDFLENPVMVLDYRGAMKPTPVPKVTPKNFSGPFAIPQSQNGQNDLEVKTEAKRGTRWCLQN